MNILMKMWIYILPFPLLIFFYKYWSKSQSNNFALLIILSGIIYGYVFPGIAVNVMKKWKFKGKFMLGNYYAHHGLKYSSNMNLCFFIATLGRALSETSSLESYISIVLSTGFIQGFWIWVHDTLSIKRGMLEIHNVLAKEGDSAEQITFKYAPPCFFALGACFAASSLLLLHYVDLKLCSISMIVGYAALQALFIGIITSTLFGLLESFYKK